MAKKRVLCPECGLRHTVIVGGLPMATTGVRAKRITNNQFEYSLTAPQAMIEAERFTTVLDDLILSGAVGVAAGSLCAWCASLAMPTDYLLQVFGIGASGGLLIAWGWLCAEYNTRLKRVLPWFIEQKEKWPQTGGIPINDGEIALTVDHRHRDSYSEQGRSISFLGVLPVDVGRFIEYAQAAIRGDSLAIRHWTGKEKLFSRNEYEELLEMLRQSNIIANLPGKGNRLTNPGRHALKRVLKGVE